MNQNPLVSVVIPCYNHAEFVQETIQSVIDQDYENIELIIIDDGSKDNSVEVIKEMIPACEARFKRFEFRYRPNKGLCSTLNEAIKWCCGKYIGCIASDDILVEDKTSYQVKYLEGNPSCIGVFGEVEVFDKECLSKVRLRRAKKNNFNDIFTNKHHLPAPTQLLRLDAVKNVGGYREDLIIEDWSMWLFLTENGGTLDYVRKVFAKYRRHDGNLSSRFEVMAEGRRQILTLFKNKKNYNKAKAMALMVHAHDVQTVDKVLANKEVVNIIVGYPTVILSSSFLRFLLKSILV